VKQLAEFESNAPTQPKLEFLGVSKTFAHQNGTVTALDNVSLDIGDNEFVSMVGPSGCGKSTMLNIAAGLDTPSSGNVRVGGKRVSGPSPERGVIFQQYALFPWLTVRKNVEFGLRIKKISARERREISDRYLQAVGLADFADMLPKTLSGGMKQRCAVARAYAVQPEVLLMDEPFGALDALTRVQLQDQLLATWSQERRTVLFITHDVDEAVYLSDRVVVMGARPGRIIKTVNVDLPRPRTEEMRLSPEFAEIRAQLWNAVYHQSSGAVGTNASVH
jgi:NitT/TauT family transport system ATP-binding protein